jgi:hypothetical protein
MVDALIVHLQGIFSLSWVILLVIGGLCAITCYLLKDYLTHPPLAILIFPMMMFFAMVVQYLVICAELFSSRNIEQWLMWTIFSSICGSVLGVALVGGLAVLRYGSGATDKAARGQRSLSA